MNDAKHEELLSQALHSYMREKVQLNDMMWLSDRAYTDLQKNPNFSELPFVMSTTIPLTPEKPEFAMWIPSLPFEKPAYERAERPGVHVELTCFNDWDQTVVTQARITLCKW